MGQIATKHTKVSFPSPEDQSRIAEFITGTPRAVFVVADQHSCGLVVTSFVRSDLVGLSG